jgi:benzoylformate decarboxylase
VLGDPARVCERMAEGVSEKLDDDVRDERLENVRSSKNSLEPMMRQMGEDEADSPRSSKAELVDAMVDEMSDAYVVDEGVTSKYALLTRFPFEEAQYLGNKGGGLGYGLPASVGAALAHKDLDVDRQVVGFIGDGSYFYYPQTVYTAVREKLDMAIVVPNNDGYTILRNNADDILGKEGRDYVGTVFEPRTNVVNSAKAYGANATRVETPDGLNDALSEAKEEGVHVVDVAIHD